MASVVGERSTARRIRSNLASGSSSAAAVGAGDGDGVADADEDCRQVVFRPALVTDALELLAGRVERRRMTKERGEFLVRDVARDAVGAEEEGRAALDLDGSHVNLDRLFGSECATDDVSARMVRGLLRRHASGPDFFFDERVVFGLAAQLAVGREAVEARVADVSNRRAKSVE